MEINLKTISKDDLIALWEAAQLPINTHKDPINWLMHNDFGSDLYNTIGYEIGSLMLEYYRYGSEQYNIDKQCSDDNLLFNTAIAAIKSDKDLLATYKGTEIDWNVFNNWKNN